jgi:hypothetical protein
MTNIERALNSQPYGDNLVARCDYCGKAIHLCTCDDEDWEDDGETHPNNEGIQEDELTDGERYENKNGLYEEPTDSFGRNYSDADPGL